MSSMKPTSDAAQNPDDGEKATFANKLIDQVLDRMELDELTAVVAEKMCEKWRGLLMSTGLPQPYLTFTARN